MTLLEVVAALGLLGVGMVLTLQILSWTALERREADRRDWALREAENILERLTPLPWDRLTPDAIRSLSLDRRAGEALPGGEVRVEVIESEKGPPSKRLVVQVRWRGRSGEFVSPVRLTAWVYRRGGTT